MTNHIAIGTAMLLYGLIIVLNSFGFTSISIEKTLSIVFIVFGLTTYINSFHKLRRGGLFLTSVFMNIGIILFVLANFEILNRYSIITPSIFYITASGLFALYIENKNEIVFLISAILFFVLAISTVFFVQKAVFIFLMHKITLLLFNYWPLFLILFGVLLMTHKKREKSTASTSA